MYSKRKTILSITAILLSGWVASAAERIDPTRTSPQAEQPTGKRFLARTERVGARAGERQFAPAAGIDFLTTNQLPEGDMPRSLVFTANGTEVVIANRDTDTVCFLDATTRLVTHSLDVGDYPLDVTVTPDNRYAFVANALSNTVTAIDVATHTIAATIPVTGSQPYIVRATTDSQTIIVGVINDAVQSTISVIDTNSLSEVRSFGTVPQGVFGFFFTPESGISGEILTQFDVSTTQHLVVLPDRFNTRVALYDYTNGTETLLVSPASATSVDVSLDGSVAVVGCESTTRRVCTVDLASKTLTNSFSTTSDLSDQVIRLTHDKSHALFAILNNVQFINLTSGTTTATISTGIVGDIELTFDGQYAFVSNFNARVIDVASQALVKTLTFAACADAAASPVDYRVVALNNRFREDAQFYRAQGAAAVFEGAVLSGPPEEGDAPRTLAVSADGRTLIVAHNTSDNVAVIDLVTRSVRAYLPTGPRNLGCAISADGTVAVVASAGNDTLSVLDLVNDQRVATLSVPSVPAEVLISPDGQTAYVTSVAGTDRLYFVRLNGASSSILGSLITGQMGSIVYTYGVMSGMSLSPDGATLALCISFDDQLMLVDTATRTEVKRLTVGDFPIRAAFSPDSGRIYVTHSFSDDLYAVSNAGAGSAVLGSVAGIEFPLGVTVAPDGAHSFVGSFDFNTPRLYIVNNATLTVSGTRSLGSPPRSQTSLGDDLYLSLTDGELLRLTMAGAGTTIEQSFPLVGSPSDMVYASTTHLAVCAEPGVLDGIDLIEVGGVGTRYCTSTVNSTGGAALLDGSGSASSSAGDLELSATPVPNQNGIFFHGTNTSQQSFGNGFLCTTGGIVRGAVVHASANLATYLYDNSDSKHSLSTQVGNTRHFQYWFRDPQGGGAFFNTSDALSILIAP